MNQNAKPAPRKRVLAGGLCMIYVALMGLAFYLESTGGVDHWPLWALWVAGATWGAIMLVLPVSPRHRRRRAARVVPSPVAPRVAVG